MDEIRLFQFVSQMNKAKKRVDEVTQLNNKTIICSSLSLKVAFNIAYSTFKIK